MAYPGAVHGSMPAAAAPTVPWHRKPWVSIVIAVIAIGFIVLGGLVIFGILGASLGPTGFLLAAGAAAIPVPFLVGGFVWLDRYEPEPWHYLAFAFAWGACVATAFALVINSTGEALISVSGGSSSATAVVVAPPTEEILKALPLFVLLILTLVGRRQINGVVDGIVYGGLSAVGFAFTENILYFGSQYVDAADEGGNKAGVDALLGIFLLRGVFSPFTHPLFTCMTGIGVGIAVQSRHWWVRILAPIGGLALAIALHAGWNAMASSGDPRIIFTGYGLFMVPFFLAVVVLAIWLRFREAKVIGKVLPAYADSGWLSAPEVAALATMTGRRAGRRWARQLAGSLGARAMSDYQFAATKLAMHRNGLLRGLADSDYSRQERDLLDTLAMRRLYIIQQADPAALRRWSTGPSGYGPPPPGIQYSAPPGQRPPGW